MKKLIYLNKFNESSNEECDFKTFKEIMMDLSDYYECEFGNYTKGDFDSCYYECELTIPQINGNKLSTPRYLTAQYLEDILPTFENPSNIEECYSNLKESVDNQIENIEKLKRNLDNIITYNNKIKKIFKILEEEIVPRFQYFSNFDICSIGLEEDKMRIWFDIKR